MEHHADIHILSRRHLRFRQKEVWVLRSDVFPSHWEQATVRAVFKKKDPTMGDFFLWN
jgi:hypothetical protein